MPLGRMQEVDLREVWTDEEGDFTPWLASEGEDGGLDILAETLGMDFDEVRTEESVGSLSADIVCIDTNDNSRVLIENQLEKTDHKHLGQLLMEKLDKCFRLRVGVLNPDDWTPREDVGE